MAKETATPAPAETKAEKKPEKKAPAESVYTVSELAGNARSVFGTMQECVVAALKTDGKAEYTVSEAKEIVRKFLQKKVEFTAGTDEANALVDALASSKNFKAEVIKSGTVTLQNVSQSQFTKGTDPQVTNGDYSNAFKQVRQVP